MGSGIVGKGGVCTLTCWNDITCGQKTEDGQKDRGWWGLLIWRERERGRERQSKNRAGINDKVFGYN